MPTLKEAREACGLSQPELGTLVGASTEDVVAWEADTAGAPIDGLRRAWIILGVSPDVRGTSAESAVAVSYGSAVAGCVVVAHELQLWRWAMVGTFRAIRPRLRVVDAPPEDLDAAVVLHTPAFVVCSALTDFVQTRVPFWVWIDAKDANRATIRLGGRKPTNAWLDVVDLVAVLDEATRSNSAHSWAGESPLD